MGSSGGGDSGAGSMAMMMQGSPMPGLPIAGKDTAIDPYTYGKFQSFLPDIKAEGQNDMATGLRPDMFKYRAPGGIADEGGGADAGGSGGVAGEIKALRDELAKITAGGAGATNPNAGTMYQDMLVPGNEHLGAGFMGGGAGRAGGGGGVGTMGMGGGQYGMGWTGGPNRMVNPPSNYQSPRAIAGGTMDPTIQQLDNAGTVFGLPPPGMGKDYRWSPTGG